MQLVLYWSWVTLPVIYIPDSSTALCQLSWLSNIMRDPQAGTVWMAHQHFCGHEETCAKNVVFLANNS